jgi:hypothetical protein
MRASMVAWARFGGDPNGEYMPQSSMHTRTATGRARRREYSRPAQAAFSGTPAPGNRRCAISAAPRHLAGGPTIGIVEERAEAAACLPGPRLGRMTGQSIETLAEGRCIARRRRTDAGCPPCIRASRTAQACGQSRGSRRVATSWSRRVVVELQVVVEEGVDVAMRSCSLIRRVNLPTTRGCRWLSAKSC